MSEFGKRKTDFSFLAGEISLAETLESGQAFRWKRDSDWFRGVVGKRVFWVRQDCGSDLQSRGGAVAIKNRSRGQVEWKALPPSEDSLIAKYLGLNDPLEKITATFPDDPHLREAVKLYRGLRILRQEPLETLASFIASSTKQIVQIKQIVANLSRELGDEIAVVDGEPIFSFPTVDKIASATHETLWNCKLGFRAKNLLATARMIDTGMLDFAALAKMETAGAREELVKCPGVGEKIANCALLFGFGKHDAFPIDVWVERALRQLYFRKKRKVTTKKLKEFSENYFGPYAGYAQQYLFHYVRMNPEVLEM